MAVTQFSQVRTAAPTGEPPTPCAGSVNLALKILDEHFEQLAALSSTLEGRLADECERVQDGAPLIEWRLAQVLNDMLASTRVQRDVACLLGRKVDLEASHG